jgi:hypothetical protein
MATPRAYPTPMRNVEFGAPTIGLKVYVCKGPSGWPETFSRKTADRALNEFVGPVDLDELVANFLAARAVDDKPSLITWPHITHYLARVLGHPLTSISSEVVVAFWAHVILAKEAQNLEGN